MNISQPYRVRLQLVDGGGVVLEAVCALCKENNSGIVCPICDRLFCADGCFEVHLNARDAVENGAVDAFLASPRGQKMIEQALYDEHVAAHGDSQTPEQVNANVDWAHIKHCVDCRNELQPVVVNIALSTPPRHAKAQAAKVSP